MNVGIGAEAAQFPEKEYINGIVFAVQYDDSTAFSTYIKRRLIVFYSWLPRKGEKQKTECLGVGELSRRMREMTGSLFHTSECRIFHGPLQRRPGPFR
jgi:hypothetical protein